MTEAAEKASRTLTGTVVSAKTAKTIAVEIERVLKHEQYGKYIRRTTRLLAHDEAGDAREGDTVTISPVRSRVPPQVLAAGDGGRARERGLKEVFRQVAR